MRYLQTRDVNALLAVNMSQNRLPCPTEAYGASPNRSVYAKTTPLHVNLSGLSDVDALRHILGLYQGSSVLVESMERLNTRESNFSRAGGILAGAC